MENNQNTQQHSAELNDSKLTHSRQQKGQRSSLNLIELIKHRPWLVWIGVLVFIYTITAVSIASLLQTQNNTVIQQEAESTSETVENPTATSGWSPRSLLYLWLLGAVAFSFVVGSVVIAKRLKVKHPSTRVLTRRQLRRRQLKVQPPLPVVLPVSPETEPMVTVQPSEEKLLIATSVKSPTDTTLPPLEKSHALDSDEVSLAEMMDIRKHLPLSVVLGDCNKFRSYQDGLTDKPVET